jgi:hypothetical protein
VEPLDPLRRARKGRETLQAYDLAISRFFCVPDPLNRPGRGVMAKPPAKDRVISLSEAGKEILACDRDSLPIQCFLPRAPVVFFRVDESSV